MDLSGKGSKGCLGRRPESRRHCAGSCIEEYESDYGWTKVIDGQHHSVYIDTEGKERFHVANLTHKAEFLETASQANSISSSEFIIFLMLTLNICTLL